MKNRNRIMGVAALLLVIAVVFLWPTDQEEAMRVDTNIPAQPKGSTAPSGLPPPVSTPTQPSNPLVALMQTPIEFYGIVLDHENNPVPSAKVEASVLDNMMKGTPITLTAGADGRFTIESKGSSLHIMVSKGGYYFVDKKGPLRPSSQGFDFGSDTGRGLYQSDAASPVVFHLRKAGNPIPLDALRGQSKVPRNGSPATIGLSKTSAAAFLIRCRTMEDDSQAPNAPYDWRCEIHTVGGGIQEVLDEPSFLAPPDGYTQVAVIDMPKSLDRKVWNSRVNKSYWLRFPDNTFGRISFMMNARGDHFAVINGFRNPTPNDRNLEPKLDAR
jgi:hypothetical protein